MYERFTDRARKVMQLANQEARRFNHDYIGTEHILLGLVEEEAGIGALLLQNLGLSLGQIRQEIEKTIHRLPPSVASPQNRPLTSRAKKAIDASIDEASNLNQNFVGTEHLLLGLLCDSEGYTAQLLCNHGVTRTGVRDAISKSCAELVHDSLQRLRPKLEAKHLVSIQSEALTAVIDEALKSISKLDQLTEASKLLSEICAELSAQFGPPPPAEMLALEEKIEAANIRKEQMVSDRDFEAAVRIRDAVREMQKRRDKLYVAWKNSRPNTGVVTAEMVAKATSARKSSGN